MALWAAFGYFVLHNEPVREPTSWWWLSRPFAFLGPLALTMPVILLRGRQYVKKAPPSAPGADAAATSTA